MSATTQPPSAGVRDYIAASGSIAVFALDLPDGTVSIEAGADPWSVAKDREDTLLTLAWTSADRAAGVVEALRAATEEGGQNQRCGALRAFEQLAGPLRLADHSSVLAVAEQAVRIVDAQYQVMKSKGDFRRINREYKAARLSGMRVPPFGVFQRDYRLSMIRMAGQRAAARAGMRI